LFWALRFDPFYLTLFYYRIGPSKASICRLIKRTYVNFTIVCWGRELIGVNLFHPFGTIINASQIGNNLSIRNNTTIGNKHNSQSNCPTIGENVDIGANVIIIGNKKLGIM
jgi:serine acetyltransferase